MMKTNEGMSLIVKTVTRVSVWLIILYGFYIIVHGHLTPGGGFGGGVIIALALLNVMLAFGKKATQNWLNIHSLHRIEALAITLFLLVGLLGLVWGTGFLANFLGSGQLFSLASAGTIPVLNILIGIKVGLSLFLVVWALSALKVD